MSLRWARVRNSIESATGAVTLKGVTYVHSGQLGEPLSETDASGAVLHQYVFAPFGARRELAAIAVPVGFSTPNPYVNDSRAVPVRGARATKLHFTELALAPCDSIIVSAGYGGPVVTVIQASTSGDFWTEWLATDNAYVELRAKGCGTARGFNLVEALPEWGGVSSQARTEVTARPYAAAGQQFRVSMGAGGFLRLKDLNVASCDALEARTPGGQVLWKWKPLPSVYQVWTSRLQGDVDIGIWGQGCNGAERKFGFALAEVRSDSGPSQPVSIGLPGQKFRADGTIDNWYRNYDADLGRYLSPEPMLQSPAYVRRVAQAGMSVPTYAYAANNPLRYVDRTGLATQVIISYGEFAGLSNVGTHAAVRVDNAGGGTPVLFDPSGNYRDSTRGSGGFFEGDEASLAPYLRYHTKQGDGVLMFSFDTTPAEEAEIAKRFGYDTDEGPVDPRGLNCAETVSTNLAGIGPFKNLSATSFPGSLEQQLCRLAGVCAPRVQWAPPKHVY